MDLLECVLQAVIVTFNYVLPEAWGKEYKAASSPVPRFLFYVFSVKACDVTVYWFTQSFNKDWFYSSAHYTRRWNKMLPFAFFCKQQNWKLLRKY